MGTKIEERYVDTTYEYLDGSPSSSSRGISGRTTYNSVSLAGDRRNPTDYVRQKTVENYFLGNSYYPDVVIVRGIQPLSTGYDYIESGSTVKDEALTDMYEKLRGSIDLTIDGAQWRNTAGAAKQLAASMERLSGRLEVSEAKWHRLRMLQPAKFKRFGRNAFKEASSLWLQWQYGIKPTASTLQGLMTEATRVNNPPTVTVTGKAHDTFIHDSNLNAFGKKLTTQRERARIVCTFAPVRDTLERLAGIASLNPVSIGYELLPFSFVLDWVVDIGSYLRNMETAFLHGSNFVKGYTQFGQKWEFVHEVDFYKHVDGLIYQCRTTGARTYYERRVLSSIPYPAYPRVNPKLGWQRLLSASSLLAQLLPSETRKRVESGKRR